MEGVMNINIEYLKYVLIYLAVINLIGFLSMGIDKFKAKHNMWRIPEKTLLLIPLLGGSIGSLIGMYTFRHKTLHPQFKYGIPCLLFVNGICLAIVFAKFIIVK